MSTGQYLLFLAVATVLGMINAFFVLAEFAIVKVRTTRIREMAQSGGANARLAYDILQKMDVYLSACQVGVTIASLAIGWLAEPALASVLQDLFTLGGWQNSALSHGLSFGLALVFITAIHVMAGEQAPKMLAIRKAEASILLVARPLRIFYLAAYPLLAALNWGSNALLRMVGIDPAGEKEIAHTEEELKMILGASHEQGQFTLSRLLMMENVLDFGTLTVADVMIPKEKVVLLDPAKPWAENFATVQKAMHSRYPLAGPRITKAVHIKDMMLAMGRGQTVDLNAIARPIHAVPPALSLEGLLTHFHSSATHLAVVEREGFAGVVTLEDVIEELIGTIRDEFEKADDHRLAEIVPASAVVLDLEGQPKEAAIRTLVLRLAAGKPGIDTEKAIASILKRERLASTGLGDGIAIPHGRVEGLPRPCAAIGRSKGGIDFASLDGKPAHLIFLILTPTHDEGAHVHILEKISTLLASDYLREQLSSASTPQEVFEVFRLSDKSLPA